MRTQSETCFWFSFEIIYYNLITHVLDISLHKDAFKISLMLGLHLKSKFSNIFTRVHLIIVIGYFLHNLWRVSISIRWYLYIAIRAYWGGTSVGNVPTRTISPTLMAIIYDPSMCNPPIRWCLIGMIMVIQRWIGFWLMIDSESEEFSYPVITNMVWILKG